MRQPTAYRLATAYRRANAICGCGALHFRKGGPRPGTWLDVTSCPACLKALPFRTSLQRKRDRERHVGSRPRKELR